MKQFLIGVILIAVSALAGCSAPGSATGTMWRSGVEAFEGVWVDRASGRLWFDGVVPVDAAGIGAYGSMPIECIVCVRDSKDHETLVVTDVRASQVHAGLLLLGLEPGRAGGWQFDGKQLNPTPPAGPSVGVRFGVLQDGSWVMTDPRDWLMDAMSEDGLKTLQPDDEWRFAGSGSLSAREAKSAGSWYAADADGVIVGLMTFGSEVVAWSRVMDPSEATEGWAWVANERVVPPAGTRVRVVLAVERGE